MSILDEQLSEYINPPKTKDLYHSMNDLPVPQTVVSGGKVTVASLFAGGGGWEVGAVLAGCVPVWANELQDDIAAVHSRALPGSVVHIGDVTHLDPAQCDPVDILCVSPPCQGYSVARLARHKQVAGERDDLLVGLESLRFVSALRPFAVLMENVPAYAQSDVFLQIVSSLKEMGYRVDWRTVDTSDYDVPSSRRRLVLRATKCLLPPWPKRAPATLPWDVALADLLPTIPDMTTPMPRYMAKSLTATNPPQGVDLLLWSGGAQRHTADGDRVLWVPAGKVGPTVTATFKSIGTSAILRADGTRKRFTARCAARLQSFPDWYPLPDNNVLAFKVVGNAVPPRLAYHVIRSVLSVLDAR